MRLCLIKHPCLAVTACPAPRCEPSPGSQGARAAYPAPRRLPAPSRENEPSARSAHPRASAAPPGPAAAPPRAPSAATTAGGTLGLGHAPLCPAGLGGGQGKATTSPVTGPKGHCGARGDSCGCRRRRARALLFLAVTQPSGERSAQCYLITLAALPNIKQ